MFEHRDYSHNLVGILVEIKSEIKANQNEITQKMNTFHHSQLIYLFWV